jgi:hypothetical protein
MSSAARRSRDADCRSLATKIAVYVSETESRSGSARTQLQGLTEYAADLAGKEDRTTLLALSREVDTWLREAHEPTEALVLVARMQSRSVLEVHLPVLVSAKKLRTIANRGTIKSSAEAQLVQSVFANTELVHLLREHGHSLGAALDQWQIGLRHVAAEA